MRFRVRLVLSCALVACLAPDLASLLAGERKGEEVAPPRTTETVRAALEETTAKFDLEMLPLATALKMIREKANVNVVVDPSFDLETEVNFKTERVKLSEALARLVKLHEGGRYEVWRGVVFVTTVKSPRSEAPPLDLTDATWKVAKRLKLTLTFKGEPLDRVVELFTQKAQSTFELEKGVTGKITVEVKEVDLESALHIVCRLAQTKIEKVGSKNVFKSRK